MRTFLSKQPTKEVSHPDLKKAAGNVTFVARFFDHTFRTENKAIADALVVLIDAGKLPDVKEAPTQAEALPTTNAATGSEPQNGTEGQADKSGAPTAETTGANTASTSSGKGKGAANGAN